MDEARRRGGGGGRAVKPAICPRVSAICLRVSSTCLRVSAICLRVWYGADADVWYCQVVHTGVQCTGTSAGVPRAATQCRVLTWAMLLPECLAWRESTEDVANTGRCFRLVLAPMPFIAALPTCSLKVMPFLAVMLTFCVGADAIYRTAAVYGVNPAVYGVNTAVYGGNADENGGRRGGGRVELRLRVSFAVGWGDTRVLREVRY
eukprot:305740-Rhodomonas_salina.2